jgi:hypothetical protein
MLLYIPNRRLRRPCLKWVRQSHSLSNSIITYWNYTFLFSTSLPILFWHSSCSYSVTVPNRINNYLKLYSNNYSTFFYPLIFKMRKEAIRVLLSHFFCSVWFNPGAFTDLPAANVIKLHPTNQNIASPDREIPHTLIINLINSQKGGKKNAKH